jgi:hypothetical protein
LATEPEISDVLRELLEKEPASRLSTADIFLTRFPDTESSKSREELGAWMQELFGDDLAAEQDRRNQGVDLLKREPVQVDDLLSGVPRTGLSEELSDS